MALPTGIYSSIMQGFAGNLPDDQKTNLWQQFKTLNGLPATPPEVASTEAKFVSFLATYTTAQTLALSPEEIQKRQTLASVIEIIMQLMRTVQQTDVEQNALLLFYTKYQSEYTKMEGNTPIYLGAQSPTLNIDLSDPSKFTLGYNNISMTDIAAYLTQPITGIASSDAFSITTPTTYFYQPSSGNPAHFSWTITFNKPDANGHGSINLYINTIDGFASSGQSLQQSYNVVVNPNDSQEKRQASYASQIESFMQSHVVQTTPSKTITVFSSSLSATDNDLLLNHSITIVGSEPGTYTIPYPLPNYASAGGLSPTLVAILNATPLVTVNVPPARQFTANWTFASGAVTWPEKSPIDIGIPWRYTTENVPGESGTDNDNFVKTNAVVQQRAAVNQKNEQFIEGIKSKLGTIQSNYDGMNTDIQSSNSSLKGQMSIITSTLQTLKAILTGIFG